MRSIYLLILLFLSLTISAQEVVTGLQFNPVVRAQSLKYKQLKSLTAEDTLPVTLPFFDDFLADSVFPSSLRWIDRYGFVNTDYPVYPVDRGVVTLDAINDTGSMYPDAVSGPQTFIADHLTSRYIRLDSVFSPVPRALHPSDSVYLSFYYQPQGRGSAPHASDSLVLQFLVKPSYDSIAPGDTTVDTIPDKWKYEWSVRGMALDSFYMANNLFFKRVMIPITDTLFFKKKFRIQFYNYVSLAGSGEPSWQSNTSQWNIDEIYLNYGRSIADTILPEIRFVERPPSFLKNYQSMPYTQFSNNPSNEMIDSLSMILTNRDAVPHTVKYSYNITQPGSSFTKNFTSPAINLLPYNQYAFGYVEYPPVPFTFPISTQDSTTFEIQHVVHDLTAGSMLADTISSIQKYYNYYAYDDGTPEAGYGLKGTGGQMAYRFKLNKSPDTLRAVRFYFNHTLSKSNIQVFYLTVWTDNSGFPGDTIYSRLVLPQYSDSLNKLTTYLLENPVRISGTFYIGTIQTTDDNLNIGLDTYDNAASNLFYNVTGAWISSSISGAPIVRPVIGKPLPLGITEKTAPGGNMTLYPNPCTTGKIRILMDGQKGFPANENWSVTISGLTGQQLYHFPGIDILDVSVLPSGIYVVDAQSTKMIQHRVAKLVIIK